MATFVVNSLIYSDNVGMIPSCMDQWLIRVPGKKIIRFLYICYIHLSTPPQVVLIVAVLVCVTIVLLVYV